MKNSPDFNKSFLTGIVRETPVKRKTLLNKDVLNFYLVNRRLFKHHTTGERIEKTLIISVSCWGRSFDEWNDKINKGSFLMVEGALQSRSWEDKDGKKQNIIEINADNIILVDEGDQNA